MCAEEAGQSASRLPSISHFLFRVLFVALGVFTIIGTAHALRYALCGVLLALVVCDYAWARHVTRSGGAQAEHLSHTSESRGKSRPAGSPAGAPRRNRRG
jgi:hypothetical protein